MPHYKLPSPANPKVTLKKRGSNWDSTIYHCEATGTFWILHMDRHGDRFLYAYNPDGPKPIIDKSQKHVVPSDWTGDPETIHVSHETIQDVAVGSPDAVILSAELEQCLENGDRILVTDLEDVIVGEVVKLNQAIVLVRRAGFAMQ